MNWVASAHPKQLINPYHITPSSVGSVVVLKLKETPGYSLGKKYYHREHREGNELGGKRTPEAAD